MWLYVAASVADRRVDEHTSAAIDRLLQSAEADILDQMKLMTVSDVHFSARSTQIRSELCGALNGPTYANAFGIVNSSGAVTFYCDYGVVGNPIYQQWFANQSGANDFEPFGKTLRDRTTYSEIFSEFEYDLRYVWVGDRLTLVVKALLAPETTLQVGTGALEEPHLLYMTIDVQNSLLKDYAARLELDGLSAKRGSAGDHQNTIPLTGANIPSYLIWPASRSYSALLIQSAPIILLLAVGFLGLLLVNLTRVSRLTAEIHRRERQAHHAATHDAMTGLANRLFFNSELKRVLPLASDEAPIYLGFLDLDYFKAVNDTFGHDAGDAMIIAVAHRLEQTIGPDNIAARLGGDEYAFIIGTCQSLADIDALMHRIFAEISSSLVHSGVTLTPSGSCGVYEIVDPNLTEAAALKRADLALYEAKNAGRNQFIIHRHDMALNVADAA